MEWIVLEMFGLYWKGLELKSTGFGKIELERNYSYCKKMDLKGQDFKGLGEKGLDLRGFHKDWIRKIAQDLACGI